MCQSLSNTLFNIHKNCEIGVITLIVDVNMVTQVYEIPQGYRVVRLGSPHFKSGVFRAATQLLGFSGRHLGYERGMYLCQLQVKTPVKAENVDLPSSKTSVCTRP